MVKIQQLKDKIENLLIEEGLLEKTKTDDYNFYISYNSKINVFGVDVEYNNDLDIDDI